MGKISKHDSWQQYNKNNDVAWGKSKDNEHETVPPTSGAPGPVTKTEKKVASKEESVLNPVVDIEPEVIEGDIYAEDLEPDIEPEVIEEKVKTGPGIAQKGVRGFQKKTT